jgi:hypothetical protein
MSNETNQIIIERIVEEVEQMSTSAILREIDGGMRPGMCDSWDERVALTDRDWAIAKLSNKRFEEWPQGS